MVECYIDSAGRLHGANGKYVKGDKCTSSTPGASKLKKTKTKKSRKGKVERVQEEGMPDGYWYDAANRLRGPNGYLAKNPYETTVVKKKAAKIAKKVTKKHEGIAEFLDAIFVKTAHLMRN